MARLWGIRYHPFILIMKSVIWLGTSLHVCFTGFKDLSKHAAKEKVVCQLIFRGTLHPWTKRRSRGRFSSAVHSECQELSYRQKPRPKHTIPDIRGGFCYNLQLNDKLGNHSMTCPVQRYKQGNALCIPQKCTARLVRIMAGRPLDSVYEITRGPTASGAKSARLSVCPDVREHVALTFGVLLFPKQKKVEREEGKKGGERRSGFCHFQASVLLCSTCFPGGEMSHQGPGEMRALLLARITHAQKPSVEPIPQKKSEGERTGSVPRSLISLSHLFPAVIRRTRKNGLG